MTALRTGIVGALLLAALVLLPPLPGTAGDTERDRAVAVAAGFLASLDAKTPEQAWQQFSPLARIAKPQEPWQNLNRALRSAYGPLETRTVRDFALKNRYPTLPDGRYAIVQFDTTFAAKHGAIETVILVLADEGRWLVHDYIIN